MTSTGAPTYKRSRIANQAQLATYSDAEDDVSAAAPQFSLHFCDTFSVAAMLLFSGFFVFVTTREVSTIFQAAFWFIRRFRSVFSHCRIPRSNHNAVVMSVESDNDMRRKVMQCPNSHRILIALMYYSPHNASPFI